MVPVAVLWTGVGLEVGWIGVGDTLAAFTGCAFFGVVPGTGELDCLTVLVGVVNETVFCGVLVGVVVAAVLGLLWGE